MRSGDSISVAAVGKQTFIAGLMEGSTTLSKNRLEGEVSFCTKREAKNVCENAAAKICVIER